MPDRATTPELLDADVRDPQALAENLADLRVVNRWLGGTGSVLRALELVLPYFPLGRPLPVLDVATGSGDVPLALIAWGQRRNLPLQVYASDLLPDVLALARSHTAGRVPLLRHDALRLPCADGALAAITCAQALHHFDPDAAVVLLRELARAAQVVIVCDLARSRYAYWGARALALTQRSPMSRHDGPLSVLRAYTPAEVRALCRQAGLHGAVVRRDGPLRLTAIWCRQQ